MTTYKICYQLANRVRVMEIEAASPMQAFKIFKERMPKIIYNNLSINEIKVDIPHKVYLNKHDRKLCCPCNNVFDKLLKAI